ncbi:MAG: hypothetical protein IJH53_10990 [Oscillospiraceae bacterium]|nr:hypothetical protein [Oscillospiraceae bacterium]MBR0461674.1 hypothetical protein [Erysipelotrichaceae bacterium]
MKKFLICPLLALLLACSGGLNTLSSKNIQADENIAEEASIYVTEGDEIGDGISVYAYEDGEFKEADLALYPIYSGDELTSLFLYGEDDVRVISDDKLNSIFLSDDAHIFVLCDDKLYCCGSEDIYSPEGQEEDIKEIFKDYSIEKGEEMIKRRLKINRASDTVIVDGSEYAGNRIVVVFNEGDAEEMIKVYEEFIGGHKKSSLKSLGAYVFTFEKKSASQLKELLDATLELDYVKNAWLDKVNHTTGGNDLYGYAEK